MVKQRALPVQVWLQDLFFFIQVGVFFSPKQPNYFTVIKHLHDCRTVLIQTTLLQWQHSADGRQLPCPQTTEVPAASVPESLLPHSPRRSHVSSPAAVHFWPTEFRSQKLKGVFFYFAATWVRCSPFCACWMCLASYRTATCPLWRRRCLTSPSTPGPSPASPGPRPPAGSPAASVTAPCGAGGAGWGSNCNQVLSWV